MGLQLLQLRSCSCVTRGTRKKLKESSNAQSRQITSLEASHRHPHQLRHSAATELRKEFNIETARIILGHRSAAVTTIYAEADQRKAIEAITMVG